MFCSVTSEKVSENIIGQIRRAIFEGRLRPGDRLPSEKEMVKNFKVSRATLREALRSLEVLGFLEMKKGVSGGAFVTEVDLKKARDCFANFLLFKNLSIGHLAEVRLLFEAHIAEKAVPAVTEASLDQLKALISECDHALKSDATAVVRKNEIEFHRVIANMTGNPILNIFLDFVENLLLDTKDILQPGKRFSLKVQRAHKRIYKALLNRDVRKTRAEMIKHVQEVEQDLLALQGERHIAILTLPLIGQADK
jgi:GntR family transcriptional regulator, transcriptional repressor for pyruvate dehydrogenase complex